MSVGSVSPFRPTNTVSINATSTSANAPLAGAGDTVVVTNASNSVGYVRFGSDLTVQATATDMPILPNSRLILSVNSLIAYAAALLPSGSGTIMFSRGDGSVI